MFNSYLAKTNEKTVEYFETLFKKYFNGEKNIPNSIVLWGSDCLAQYLFAIEIARNLNCQKNRENNCDCLNCRWIYKNKHPEIKTVSKIDSKPSNDETKNISIKQIHELLLEVSKKSSDYRVVIFCDADIEKISDEQINHLNMFGELKDVILEKSDLDKGKYWVPKPLNSTKILQDTSSNALLKTIEETPKNLTFIFLTASYDDLIPTILSRSQMFYIQNMFNKKYDFSIFNEILRDYPNGKKEDFYIFTQSSLKYMTENEIPLFDYLENMQAYFTEFLKNNYSNPQLREKILANIKDIIRAKEYKLASIKDEYVLDDLWINLC